MAAAWLLFEWGRIFSAPRGDFPNHWELGRRLIQGTFIYEGGLDFVYPPFWALAHVPLTLVSAHAAQILAYPLAPLAMVALVWVLHRLAQRSLPLGPTSAFWPTALAIFLASPFLSRDLPEVGVNTALVALSWVAVYLWSRGRDIAGGVCLGLASALKCTPLLFVAYFALKRQRRLAAAAIIATLGFTAAPLLVQGPAAYARTMAFWGGGIARGVLEPDPSRGVLGEEKVENLALRPALARYLMHLPYGHMGRPETGDTPGAPERPPDSLYLQFGDLPPIWAGWLVRAIMLVPLAWIGWRFRHRVADRGDPAILWECATVSLLILLYSPITWKQHCVGVLPALYLICRRAWAGRWLSRGTIAAVAIYAVLTVVLNREVVGRDATKLLDSYRIKTVAILLLTASTVACRLRLPAKASAAEATRA
jgi:alpha-1,2-mannosyltransferase